MRLFAKPKQNWSPFLWLTLIQRNTLWRYFWIFDNESIILSLFILIGWQCKVKTSLKGPWYIVIKCYSRRVGVLRHSILKSPWTRTSFYAWIDILGKYKNEVIRQTKAKLISLIMIDVDSKKHVVKIFFEFLIMNW